MTDESRSGAEPVAVVAERVRRRSVLTGSEAEALWEIYRTAFEPLRIRAAARQVLRREEFLAELADPRIAKFVAADGDTAVGLATLTDDLLAVPWVSPEYFAHRFPVHAARGAVFYVPFVCTDPRRARAGVMWQLVQAFIAPVAAVGGVVGYDVCAVNNETVRFAARMDAWNRRLGARTVQQFDVQNYYVAQYEQDHQ